ncbi:hypothetical protein [Vibrio parahaemolyticus]|uniref:hypothetical protein n=1 Tax=Vibrio parahaemolyticus TaxID=670 RepID=UPI0004D5D366|nr:hypothetical protein [Vibrio parahaemolyticus]HDY8206863.1 hypothetical protein [Vibrio vulnificus]ANQ55772.1 hypothetical protein AB831_06125 [Vibrio parahaemolyticus]ASO15618.1 hypothetical protein BGM07_015165 [Vibrio parahaemolyticus]EGQ7714775.1 hypothetical protein [Vibrio parahaemolyticus]EGQ7720818.1 hypothetical protein [Vibrio parahaemolyticus]
MFFSSSSQPLVNGAHLCEELTRFLSENKSDFEQKLIPDLSHIDHMAHNVNGIKVENISFVGCNQYQLDYSYDWEVYRGCSDMNEADIEHESVLFVLNDDGFIEIDFPEYEERDTREEF